jgi:hypothetical protein
MGRDGGRRDALGLKARTQGYVHGARKRMLLLAECVALTRTGRCMMTRLNLRLGTIVGTTAVAFGLACCRDFGTDDPPERCHECNDARGGEAGDSNLPLGGAETGGTDGSADVGGPEPPLAGGNGGTAGSLPDAAGARSGGAPTDLPPVAGAGGVGSEESSECPLSLDLLPGDPCALQITGTSAHPLIVSCDAAPGSQEVRQLDMSDVPRWIPVGLGTSATVDEGGHAWIADSHDQVWRQAADEDWYSLNPLHCGSASPLRISQRLGAKSLAVVMENNGFIPWLITRDAPDKDGFEIRFWKNTCWALAPGKLSQIASYDRPDGKRVLWGLTGQGDARAWDGAHWVSLQATGLAIGSKAIIGKDGKTLSTWVSEDGVNGYWDSCQLPGGPFIGLSDDSMLLRFDGAVLRASHK